MSHLSTFISRRFEELHALLNGRGYLLDFGGREPPRWEDDPPLGLIHMRAVLLPGADEDEDEDADPDERISFTLTERWSEDPVGEAKERGVQASGAGSTCRHRHAGVRPALGARPAPPGAG